MPREHDLRARATALAQRDARLIAGVCAACGGLVREGEGVSADLNPWETGAARAERVTVDGERRRAGLPVIAGWGRRHTQCTTASRIVAQIIGVSVSDHVAGTALAKIAGRPGAQRGILIQDRWASPGWASRELHDRKPKPWAHLRPEEVEGVRLAVREADARSRQQRCRRGACAWCGASHALAWHRGPEAWSDGSPAPLCGDCERVWSSRGRPIGEDAQRACALEALSGAATFDGNGRVAALVLLRFWEVAGDDHAGLAEPWAYAAEPLAQIREAARLAWPGTLPPEIRDEYLEKSRIEQVERVRAMRERAADERAEAEAAERLASGWPI